MLITVGELFGFAHDAGVSTAHHDEQVATHGGHDSYPGDAGVGDDAEHGILGQIHHKDGTIWHIYRILVGTGLMAQLVTGIVVFMKIEGRRRNAGKK